MSVRGITADGYQEMLDECDWHPETRAEFQRLRDGAAAREALHTRIGEQARRDGLTSKWQQETLRKLRLVYALQFELAAWRARNRLPLWEHEVRRKAQRDMVGVSDRLRRARREAAAGCQLQVQWLADHAELIAALEACRAS